MTPRRDGVLAVLWPAEPECGRRECNLPDRGAAQMWRGPVREASAGSEGLRAAVMVLERGLRPRGRAGR